MGKNPRSATLSVNLPMELAQAVYQQVREGRFTSDDEVVRAALRQFLQVDVVPGPQSGSHADDAEPDRRTGGRGGRRQGTGPDR
ncbi:MAG TPA: ribbon-helix-helix domain-containing protein [Planctomycetota bacterium]|nr:ribbon-helix-helix domain-containing protein [Planctomycetota bacterium]